MTNNTLTGFDDVMLAYLEYIFGEGFMSVGGADAVRELVADVDLKGKTVVDYGCGSGGAVFLFVEEMGSRRVMGFDVEPVVLDTARQRSQQRRIDASVEFRQIEAGSLPLEDASVDVLFTKATMMYVPDKLSLCQQFFRVLRPGGIFVGNDMGRVGEASALALHDLQTWADLTGLARLPEPWDREEMERIFSAAGFSKISISDRAAWYRNAIRDQWKRISQTECQDIESLLGTKRYHRFLEAFPLRMRLVDGGYFCPINFLATKALE